MSKKRFSVQERCVVDNTDNETFEFSFKVDAEIICEKLNEIADWNEQLKKEKQELEERNQRQYKRLKELGDLMLKRDWKTLEQIVEEWEKQEELLQAEWGTYCENE